jgi:hypothetical protein
MRQLLSWRFVLAVAAIGALALGALAIRTIDDDGTSLADAASGGQITRRMDLISLVDTVQAGDDFAMTRYGTVAGSLVLDVLVNGTPRAVQVFPGTPGVVECSDLTAEFRCALLAQVLGDTIVWFALVDMSGNLQFDLPAITELDDGYAHLVNGWEVPYARVIDRAECDPNVARFSEFLDKHDEFVSVYDLTADAIVKVTCDDS